jgi:hypothetical protein
LNIGVVQNVLKKILKLERNMKINERELCEKGLLEEVYDENECDLITKLTKKGRLEIKKILQKNDGINLLKKIIKEKYDMNEIDTIRFIRRIQYAMGI